MTEATTPLPRAPEEKRNIRKHVVRAVLGIVLGLAIAEGAFWLRDRGAFPHLNVYTSDPKLGVRLRPGATERVRFGPNPVTTVRINADGYRGADWPAPKPDVSEVVVVGDSQVFGLGVEETETFAAVLGATLGPSSLVRNLGVPTYGPAEYNATLEESLAKRPARTIVYVVNLSNDLFEANRPNRDRHAVWDGWAVRKETAPASVAQFPGRSLLYTQSHAVYALRRLMHRNETDVDRGFTSEGSWRDIDAAASRSQRVQAEARNDAQQRIERHADQLAYADDRVRTLISARDNEIIRLASDDIYSHREKLGNEEFERVTLMRASRLSPGDIVSEDYGESSRDTRVTAEHIRRGTQLREQYEKEARAKALRDHDKRFAEVETRLEAAEKNQAALQAAPPERFVPESPMKPMLAETIAIAKKHDARLLVVALPLDVQVSPDEWAKYGAPPTDMTATRVLLDDIVTAAESSGAEGLDATAALKAAEPGAFLAGDIHMTPKGHAALAAAIAKALRAPRYDRPGPGLPAGRSPAPSAREWTPKSEIVVRESDPAGCETKRVREWLGIFCRHKGAHDLPAHSVTVSEGREVTAGSVPGEAILLAPLTPGQKVRATFTYPNATRVLTVDVDAAGQAKIAFEKPVVGGAPAPASSPETDAYCACFTSANASAPCSAITAPPNSDCTRTYGKDCAAVLACAAGARPLAPTCASDHARAGAMAQCRPLCAKDAPCAKGTCTEWQGGRVCM